MASRAMYDKWRRHRYEMKKKNYCRIFSVLFLLFLHNDKVGAQVALCKRFVLSFLSEANEVEMESLSLKDNAENYAEQKCKHLRLSQR